MKPLAGRRILDLSAQAAQPPHALAAAMAGRLAAAFGAEVFRPPGPQAPEGALARFLDAGKRIAPTPDACDAALGDTAALAGVAAPVTVRFSVFGPGQDPPMSEFGLLALSGLLDIVGEPEGSPWPLAGHQPAYAAGLAGLTALLAALRAGGEERIEVSLFDVTCWLNWKVAAAMLVMGSIPRRGGARSDWYTLPAADGHIALVYQEKDWPPLRDMIGVTDPRFDTRAGRMALRAEFEAAIRPWFAARTREEITREAQARRVPIGPVRWPAELLQDAQYRARGFLDPSGTPALPFLVDGVRPHG